jgi:hypothetical protein
MTEKMQWIIVLGVGLVIFYCTLMSNSPNATFNAFKVLFIMIFAIIYGVRSKN